MSLHHRRLRLRDPPPTPPPNRNPNPNSSPFRDLSNYKTPLPRFPNPNTNPSTIFFTAHRSTPRSSASSHRPRKNLKATHRLKTLEFEQSKSARKAETLKVKTLKSFANLVTAWLNWVFEKNGEGSENSRGWKRRRKSLEGEVGVRISSEKASLLRESLKGVCSLEDLKERMGGFLSKKGCDEVLFVMSKLCKNIDEGRLKMKVHCPIVTDLALKEKSIKVLLCYNPEWLRIGLYIIFGGDSLLNGEGKSDQEGMFLKLIIENQFFTHMVKSRSYVYNKLVEGLETLGSIILKRFLLLVILLDKAKCESALPLKHGIDSKDGGSPLLFNCNSHIKSSRLAVQEFLSEAMHGEGDLLSHLVIIGCKLNYQQLPLVEYEFRVKNIFEDFQDGIRLCRAIQLLKSDASILSKVIVHSDSQKKKLKNCSIALQYLKQAGVPLSDEDGLQIAPEDIVNGDKELTLSLLWNMFVHLQVPLLIDRTLLAQEKAKIEGSEAELESSKGNTELDLLLSWIQAICGKQHIEVSDFSSVIKGKAFSCVFNSSSGNEENQNLEEFSLNSEEAYKFSFIQRATAMQENLPKVFQLCDMLDPDFPYDERSAVILLVFLSSQLDELGHKTSSKNYKYKAMKSPIVFQSPFLRNALLWRNNFQPKKLLDFESPLKKLELIEDSRSCLPLKTDTILDLCLTEKAACVIQSHFRGFIARRKIPMLWMESSSHERTASCNNSHFGEGYGLNKYMTIQNECLHEMAASVIQAHFRGFIAQKKTKIKVEALLREQAAATIQSYFRRFTERKKFLNIHNDACVREKAATVIQSHYKGIFEKRKFVKIKMATTVLQTAVRAWLAVRSIYKLKAVWKPLYGVCDGYLRFMVERHTFIRIRNSVILIQRAIRVWISEKQQIKDDVINIQSFIRGHIARLRYVELTDTLEKQQNITSELENCDCLCSAATKIQSNWKKYMKRNFHLQKIYASIKIQSHWRAWYVRKAFLGQIVAVKEIQASIRRVIHQKKFRQYRFTALEMQRFIRGYNARKRLIGASNVNYGSCSMTTTYQSLELKIVMSSTLKIQRWWKHLLMLRSRKKSAILIQSFIRGLNARRVAQKKRDSVFIIQRWWRYILLMMSRKESAILIQAHFRGWIARQTAERDKRRIVVIQSYWKGYMVRKHSKEQVAELRIRLQKSCVNVDDNSRLINRLVAALSELLGYKSVTNIRCLCSTLNTATELSQKCCETLVSAGAINILLKQFHSLNRGVPDQEVLKHIISTLRNISSYSPLKLELINTPHAVEIIFQEFLRNKSEIFFVTYQLLEKLCATQEGLQKIRKLHLLNRRLNNLVRDLERKCELQKKNPRLRTGKDNTLERLRAASNLELLISR